MDLKQLESFIKVVDYGNFSRAAKSLYLTQPTVSAHISSLEDELNCKLFLRDTRNIVLTEKGKILYQYASKMIFLKNKIKEEFIEKIDEKKDTITIAASTIPSQYILPEVIGVFGKKYPKKKFKIIETDSAKVVKNIIAGIADIGLTGTVLDKNDCYYLPFYKDELMIIMPNTEKYRKIQKEETGIEWLLNESIIMREEGSGTRIETERYLEKMGIDVKSLNIVANMENPESIKRSVRNEIGITIISKLAVKEEVVAEVLLEYPFFQENEGRALNIVYQKQHLLSDAEENFIKIIKEMYGVSQK
ncbi:MAG: selenium metabolism-associated LysR family transcriptional regulator [Lachnospiraceae bacterium]